MAPLPLRTSLLAAWFFIAAFVEGDASGLPSRPSDIRSLASTAAPDVQATGQIGPDVKWIGMTAGDGRKNEKDSDGVWFTKTAVEFYVGQVKDVEDRVGIFWGGGAMEDDDFSYIDEFIEFKLKGKGKLFTDIFNHTVLMGYAGVDSRNKDNRYWRAIRRTSKALAMSCSGGTAYVFMKPYNCRNLFSPSSKSPQAEDPDHGGRATNGEIWHYHELPALMRNLNINKIVTFWMTPRIKGGGPPPHFERTTQWEADKPGQLSRTALPDIATDAVPLVLPPEAGRDPLKKRLTMPRDDYFIDEIPHAVLDRRIAHPRTNETYIWPRLASPGARTQHDPEMSANTKVVPTAGFAIGSVSSGRQTSLEALSESISAANLATASSTEKASLGGLSPLTSSSELPSGTAITAASQLLESSESSHTRHQTGSLHPVTQLQNSTSKGLASPGSSTRKIPLTSDILSSSTTSTLSDHLLLQLITSSASLDRPIITQSSSTSGLSPPPAAILKDPEAASQADAVDNDLGVLFPIWQSLIDVPGKKQLDDLKGQIESMINPVKTLATKIGPPPAGKGKECKPSGNIIKDIFNAAKCVVETLVKTTEELTDIDVKDIDLPKLKVDLGFLSKLKPVLKHAKDSEASNDEKPKDSTTMSDQHSSTTQESSTSSTFTTTSTRISTSSSSTTLHTSTTTSSNTSTSQYLCQWGGPSLSQAASLLLQGPFTTAWFDYGVSCAGSSCSKLAAPANGVPSSSSSSTSSDSSSRTETSSTSTPTLSSKKKSETSIPMTTTSHSTHTEIPTNTILKVTTIATDPESPPPPPSAPTTSSAPDLIPLLPPSPLSPARSTEGHPQMGDGSRLGQGDSFGSW